MSTIAQSINAATNGNPISPASAAKSAQSVTQADFLKLMTAQVSAQDPFDPLDQTAMLGQLAQFSQVAGTAEMNVSLGQLVEQVQAQSALLADIRAVLSAPATVNAAAGE